MLKNPYSLKLKVQEHSVVVFLLPQPCFVMSLRCWSQTPCWSIWVLDPDGAKECAFLPKSSGQSALGVPGVESHAFSPAFTVRVNIKRGSLCVFCKVSALSEGLSDAPFGPPYYKCSSALGGSLTSSLGSQSNHQLLHRISKIYSEILFKMQQQHPRIMACWFTCSWWIF